MQRSLYSAITHFHLKQSRDRHSPLPLPRTGSLVSHSLSLSLSRPSRRVTTLFESKRFLPPKLEHPIFRFESTRGPRHAKGREEGGGGQGGQGTRKQVTRLSPNETSVVYLSPFVPQYGVCVCVCVSMRNILEGKASSPRHALSAHELANFRRGCQTD